MDHLEYFWFIADFYNNPNQYMSFIEYMRLN
jgi:hypothetical protein